MVLKLPAQAFIAGVSSDARASMFLKMRSKPSDSLDAGRAVRLETRLLPRLLRSELRPRRGQLADEARDVGFDGRETVIVPGVVHA